jgi:hypothetical protein
MIKKLLSTVAKQKREQREREQYNNLIRQEAKIGGRLFGPAPAGVRREFFCLDEHTWVWHEEYTDRSGVLQIKTTRYDVRPNGILKSENGQYRPLSEQEAQHLREAAILYEQKVKNEFYEPLMGSISGS